MSVATGIEIKLLHGADLEMLAPTIRAYGWVPLNPKSACAMVAYENGKIVAFACQNPVPHVDGWWVAKEHRGTGLGEEVVKRIVDFLYEVEAPAAYVIADTPFSIKLAEENGMELVNSPVYRKVVR